MRGSGGMQRLQAELGQTSSQCWMHRAEAGTARGTDGGILFPAGLELEESSKGSKKLDAMTLIKEGKLLVLGRKPSVLGVPRCLTHLRPADMSIFGHCPAHDEFYLVVCNHCSQVVKPQAFQKHCGELGGGRGGLEGGTGGGCEPWGGLMEGCSLHRTAARPAQQAVLQMPRRQWAASGQSAAG